jgi:hypothetical protein
MNFSFNPIKDQPREEYDEFGFLKRETTGAGAGLLKEDTRENRERLSEYLTQTHGPVDIATGDTHALLDPVEPERFDIRESDVERAQYPDIESQLPTNTVRKSYFLHWNSAQRSATETPGKYVLKFDRQYHNIVCIEVIRAMIPNSMYTINLNNNTFRWGGNTVTVPVGNYTIDSLLSELVSLTGLSMSINNVTNKITISSVGAFEMPVSPMGIILGFVYSPSNTVHVGAKAHTIGQPMVLDIMTDVSSIQKGPTVTFVVDADEKFIEYENIYRKRYFHPVSTMSELSIEFRQVLPIKVGSDTLRTSVQYPVDFNGVDHELQVEVVCEELDYYMPVLERTN